MGIISSLRNARVIIGALLTLQVATLALLSWTFISVQKAQRQLREATYTAEQARDIARGASDKVTLALCRIGQVRNEQMPMAQRMFLLCPGDIPDPVPTDPPTYDVPD